MDRSVLDIRKDEEKHLGKALYNKLRILAELHKPSDQFLRVLSEDMFLKPNPEAFFQVMRYLFELLDPAEFKKRFYWPVCDKKSEAYFRTSTVQYLSYLTEKHHLKLSQITNYLVLVPGGIKFITFMLEFLEFLVTVLIKRRKRQLSEFVDEKRKKEYKNLDIRNFKRQQEDYIRKCVAYAKKIESSTVSMKKTADIFEKKLGEIAKNIGISVDRLKDPNFIKEFEEDNWKLYGQEYAKLDQLAQLNSSLTDLKEKIQGVLRGETEMMVNKERLQESHNMIQQIFPDLRKYPLCENSELNYDAAIKAFNHILPIVHKQLNEIQQRDFQKLEFESTEMERLCNDFVQLDAGIINALQNCRQNSPKKDAKTPNREGKLVLNSSLEHKFINTPPIKFDIDHVKIIKPHLPLVGNFCAKDQTFSFAKRQTLLPPGKSSNRDVSFATHLRQSRGIDAHALLRTIRKQNNTVRSENGNLSILAPKPKGRNEMFAHNEASSQNVRPNLGLRRPAVKVSHARDNEENNPPEGTAYPRKNVTDFDLAKVSTSPSGRLECFVKPDYADIPKLLLNDEPILRENKLLYNMEKFVPN